MARNIVVCCDGTSNEFCEHNTNVVKLVQLLVQDLDHQVVYYHPGLGTMEAVGALTSVARKVTKALDLAIGYELESDVACAYRFVMDVYQPGDRLYLFGFSRGAYTVRVLAALLHVYGVIRRGNEHLVDYAIRLQSAKRKAEDGGGPKFELADGFAKTFGSGTGSVPIAFVGVWDTVSSIGWIGKPLALPYTASNPSILIGRHAISIDERRAFFRSNRFRPKPGGGPKDLDETYFPGDHSDVGGGHPTTESALSDNALRWMVEEASRAGLLFSPAAVAPQHAAGNVVPPTRHESLKDWWFLAEFVFKKHWDEATKRSGWRMNLFQYRTLPSDSKFDASVEAQGADYLQMVYARKAKPPSI